MAYCKSLALTGIAGSCESSMGGIIEVYLNHKDNISGVPTVSDDKITGITLVTPGTGSTENVKFKQYHFKKNTGSMSSAFTIDPANGVNFVQTDLSLVFGRQDTAKRIEIGVMALDDLVAIVKDSNGKYWYLGFDEPVSATAAGAETGTNRTDGNKYTITLQDTSLKLPYEVLKKEGSSTTGVDFSVIIDGWQ